MVDGVYKDGFWISAAPVEELAKLTLPGPEYLCRPPWPSFLEDLGTRDAVSSDVSCSDLL
jgi:hypothetical protein